MMVIILGSFFGGVTGGPAQEDVSEVWKSVRIAMPNPDETPAALLRKLAEKLETSVPATRQWLKDENIVINVGSVLD